MFRPFRSARGLKSVTDLRSFARSPQAVEALEKRQLLAAHIVGNPTVFQTIQEAVNAAPAGATINVDAGVYSELVTVYKTLTIRGPQAGVDGRSNARNDRGAEAILNGAQYLSGRSTSFFLNADNIVLDGFTIEGQTATSTYGAAIHMGAGRSGIQVINNIIQHNATGIHATNTSADSPGIIRNNLFRENNQEGPHSGRAIYSDGSLTGGVLNNLIIDNNVFFKNHGYDPNFAVQPAIGLEAMSSNSIQTNIQITNNIFDYNGKGILLYNASNVTINHNVFTHNRDTTSANLRLEGGMSNVAVQNNLFYANGARAIRIDKKAFNGENSNFTITNNNFFGNGKDSGGQDTALMVDAGMFSGTLNATGNWWGSANGPSINTTSGAGDTIWTGGNSIDYSGWATAPIAIGSTLQLPYFARALDATSPIMFVDFDHGGQGVAHQDTTSSNQGNVLHRYQAVDIQTTSDPGFGITAGHYVGYVKTGEWLEYTVNVPAAGTYDMLLRVANPNSPSDPGTFHVDIDGVNVTGTASVMHTGSFSTWGTQTLSNIALPAGTHVMRIVFDAAGSTGSVGNFNWFRFVPANVALPPAAPSNLVATAANSTTIDLTWSDNSSDETGFKIERKIGPSGAWELIATPGANTTAHQDLTAQPGTSYVYRVRAVGSAGDSGNSNEAAAATPPGGVTYLSDLPFVGTPTNGWGPVERDMSVGGSGSNDGAIITLNGVTYAKGLGTHAYAEVLFQLDGIYDRFLSDIGIDDRQGSYGSVVFQVFADNVKVYESPVMGPHSATESIDVSVAGAQQLKLVVLDAGDGVQFDHADWAGARLMIAQASTAPAAPSNLAATPVAHNRIDLTWSDNATNETGFIVERSLNGVDGWLEIATKSANITAHSDTTVNATTQYHYRVRAINGVGPSANSNIASATTPAAPTIPAAPGSLAATAISSSQITLTWTDNANNETGFIIERSINGIDGWTQVGTTAENVTTFSNTGLSPGTQYFYRVRATNAAGDSGNSNIASASTFASTSASYISPGAAWRYLDDGSNQGTAWRELGFEDSTWKSGAAELGYGDGDETTVVSYGGNATNKHVTTYFRKTFAVENASLVTALQLRLKRDDGVVVYLNGSEVFRDNMPSGTITYTTAASSVVSGGGESTWLTGEINPALLVSGTNLIAVEIHQDSLFSSDISFDFELMATLSATPAAPAAPSSLAASAVAHQQIDLTWSDNATNETGFVIERSLNGVDNWIEIATRGANVTTHSDTTVSPSTEYFYRVRAVNGVGPSGNSNVASATTPALPTIPAAPSNLIATAVSASQINLSWTDNATDESGFIIERSLNGTDGWTEIGTAGANATSFSNTTGLASATQYFFRVRATNAAGDSAHSNIASATTTAAPSNPTLIAPGAVWRYLDDGSNQGTAWRELGFEDSTWKSGAAQLGYGDGDEATVVSYGGNATNKHVTTYFRKTFTVADAASVTALAMRVIRDDGVVVYLNGTEIYRNNVPTGTITYTTAASSVVSGSGETTWLNGEINPALLASGTNVIAVEIHQDSLFSSDTSFDFELTATTSGGGGPTITAPAAPSNLAASAVSQTQINLSWSDNATNESGFVVERSLNGVDGWIEIATKPADATTHSDASGLAAGTQYFYRVRAINSAGASSNSNVASATTLAAPTTGLPTPWTSGDIGSVGTPGKASYSNGIFTVEGAGSDIWNKADAFHFVYQTLDGDGQILARVDGITNTDAFAKAGVMIRESLAAGSKHGGLFLTPANGLTFVRRTSTNGGSSSTKVSGVTAPHWVKLIRSGSTITALHSPDGIAWTQIGSVSISMGSTVYIGLAVTSKKTALLNTSTFSNVAVSSSTSANLASAPQTTSLFNSASLIEDDEEPLQLLV